MHAASTTQSSSMNTLELSDIQPQHIMDEEKQQAQSKPEPDFLVHWEGENDPLNPRSFSIVRRWYMVLIISLGSLLV
jgi:hypothetical protein